MEYTANIDKNISSVPSSDRVGIPKGVCNLSLGETKPCRYCGTMLNWLDHKPIEYRSGNFYIKKKG